MNYTPQEKKLYKNSSASQLKLSQRLKEKRLIQHLEDSVVVKTVTSDIRSNDEVSQSSLSKISSKIPGSRYREVRKSQERNKNGILSTANKLYNNARN